MAANLAVDLLRDLGLLNWPTLLVGWKRRQVSRADLIDFAVAWLLKHPDEEDSRIVEMASGEQLDDAELTVLLSDYVETVSRACEEGEYSAHLDRWRLAEVWILASGELDVETKLDRLEQLYADYDYPEDMARCSRYYVDPSQEQDGWAIGDSCQSPLDAMGTLLIELCTRFGVRDRLPQDFLAGLKR